jgi:hypothetical protein
MFRHALHAKFPCNFNACADCSDVFRHTLRYLPLGRCAFRTVTRTANRPHRPTPARCSATGRRPGRVAVRPLQASAVRPVGTGRTGRRHRPLQAVPRKPGLARRSSSGRPDAGSAPAVGWSTATAMAISPLGQYLSRMSNIEAARQAIRLDPGLQKLWQDMMAWKLADTGNEILAYRRAATAVLAEAENIRRHRRLHRDRHRWI